jgi:hypothetical protein
LSVSINDAPVLTKELERLPGVQRVQAALESLNAFPLTPRDTAILPAAFTSGEIQPIGCIDGEYFDQDRVTVTAGRMADPRRADEFVATSTAARLLGWHFGEVIAMGFYTNAQEPTSKPQLRLRMKLQVLRLLHHMRVDRNLGFTVPGRRRGAGGRRSQVQAEVVPAAELIFLASTVSSVTPLLISTRGGPSTYPNPSRHFRSSHRDVIEGADPTSSRRGVPASTSSTRHSVGAAQAERRTSSVAAAVSISTRESLLETR